MRIPTISEAEKILRDAKDKNDGRWIEHSKNVASIARKIANHLPDYDEDTAYILGLLHDIGRGSGNYYLKHTVDGYNFLKSLQYDDAARICITHSFPHKDFLAGVGSWDGSHNEKQLVISFLDDCLYDKYDELVQLCDNLALDTGFTCLEVRLVDIGRRYGLDSYTMDRWEKLFAIKESLEKRLLKSIYSLYEI
jgi:putative nucleotidyltransferase with HDIG domain